MNKEFNSDEFLMLLLKQLEGVASPSEQAYIEHCLATEPLARELQADAEAVFSDADVRRNFMGRDEQQNLQKIHASVRKKRLRKNLLITGTGATILAIFVTGFYYLRTGSLSTRSIQDGPVLELSDGKLVKLDRASVAGASKDSTVLLQRPGQLTIVLRDNVDNESGFNTLKVPKGYIYNVTLSDGTVVHLNSDSHLKFPFRFQKYRREVFVDGEAFFEVSKDAGRPFVVRTSKVEIRVLGTQFNLNTYKGMFTLALVSGSVAILQDGKQTALQPGYKASLSKGQQALLVEHFDKYNLTSWIHGEFSFEDIPLEAILDVVNRWYNYPVVYDDPEMAKATFTGILRKKDPISSFINNIEVSGHANVYFTPDSTLHVKKDPRFKTPI